MKCFYHGADCDGRLSAYLVYRYAEINDGYPVEFTPMNYGKEFPFESINQSETVYIVDYSILPDEMRRLLDITSDVIWIDHHASAIKRYEEFPYEIKGIRYDGIAACMLTYCYLKRLNLLDTEKAPMYIQYIADYDVWTFKYGQDTKAFEMGVQLFDQDPLSADSIWRNLEVGFTEEWRIISKGRIILQYQDNWAKEYCEHVGYEYEFEGHKCFVMNLAMISSDYFKSIDSNEYDMFIGFSYNGKTWNYSLRSGKIDCSQIAMRYGGGGHRGAAGFSTDKFLIQNNNLL